MAINSGRDAARLEHFIDRVERSLKEPDLARLIALDPPAASGEFSTRSLLAAADPASPQGRDLFLAVRDMVDSGADAEFCFDAELRVEVSEDAMSAAATYTPPLGGGRLMTACEAVGILREAFGVVHGIDEGALVGLLSGGGFLPASACVARGTPPTVGASSRWELTTTGAESVIVEGQDGRVDYRSLPAVRAIAVGDRLAYRIPGEPGLPGCDVLGRAIAPPVAAPLAPFIAGEGAEERADGIYAIAEGELRVAENRLSVLPTRTVVGDVDYATGNVVFPGTVHITGSVLNGFIVQADGDVHIGGAITSARVEAGGAIHVAGGIIGHDTGAVIAGGDITVKFIENATVRSQGSVFVRRSILHSRVDAQGVVEVTGERGGVIGGTIRSCEGLVCHSLGSSSGTRTRIHFGENPIFSEKLGAIDIALMTLRERQREVEMTLSPLAHPAPGTPLAANHDQLVEKLLTLRTRLLENVQTLVKNRMVLVGMAGQVPEGEIKVAEETLPGVVLSSRGVDRTIETRHIRTRFRRRGKKIEVCAYD